MIGRRSVIGGALALALPQALHAAPLPVPPAGRLGFEVWRGSRKLGHHDLAFHPQGDALMVDIAVDIAFRIGPITLYRYTHHARERWQGDDVVGLETETNDNGTAYRVRAHRDRGTLMVEPGGKPAYAAPADALPATHWNHREVETPWINTQNGALLRPQVAQPTPIAVPNAAGQTLRVRRYALSGPVTLDLWYDDAQQWAGLSFDKGGTPVRYLRKG